MSTHNTPSPHLHTELTNWVKSTRSGNGNHCVERGSGVTDGTTVAAYRDTKQAHLSTADRPLLVFSAGADTAFRRALLNGRFELPS